MTENEKKQESKIGNSLFKFSVKTAYVGALLTLGPSLFIPGYIFKTMVVTGLLIYSGAVDNIVDCLL